MSTGKDASKAVAAAKDRLAEVSAMAGMFGFLGRCIEEEADANLIDLLRGDLRKILGMMGPALDESFYSAPTEALVEILAEEYTGLFVAPGCISPHASVFETGCMFKEPADRAIEAYRQAGWDYQRRQSGEFPDHIGTMLGFCSCLANAETEYLAAGDMAKADDFRQKRETFLVEQLGSWGPGWCRRAAEAALHPFYIGILQMTEQLLWSELGQVVDRRRLQELVGLNLREPKRLDYDADFRKASGL